LGASQGVQAPVLKGVIDKLRKNYEAENLKNDVNINHFPFEEIHKGIEAFILEISENKDYSKNQWYGWCNGLINRIDRIVDDSRIFSIINTSVNTVEQILECPEEIILIEADFEKDEFDVIVFLFSKLLYNWLYRNRQTKQIRNVLLLFEEAHRYINEEDNIEYKLGNYFIERLAREGRKFGLGLIFSSQRPSELSKTVLSQCNSFIVHRITNKNDLEFVNRLLSTNNNNIIKLIPGLEKQYAVVIGEALGYSEIIKIESARPTPFSDDPLVIKNWSVDEGTKN